MSPSGCLSPERSVSPRQTPALFETSIRAGGRENFRTSGRGWARLPGRLKLLIWISTDIADLVGLPQDFVQAVDQLLRRKGFGDIVVHFCDMKRQHLVNVLSLCGDDNHRDLRVSLVPFKLVVYLPAVNIRHH